MDMPPLHPQNLMHTTKQQSGPGLCALVMDYCKEEGEKNEAVGGLSMSLSLTKWPQRGSRETITAYVGLKGVYWVWGQSLRSAYMLVFSRQIRGAEKIRTECDVYFRLRIDMTHTPKPTCVSSSSTSPVVYCYHWCVLLHQNHYNQRGWICYRALALSQRGGRAWVRVMEVCTFISGFH